MYVAQTVNSINRETAELIHRVRQYIAWRRLSVDERALIAVWGEDGAALVEMMSHDESCFCYPLNHGVAICNEDGTSTVLYPTAMHAYYGYKAR